MTIVLIACIYVKAEWVGTKGTKEWCDDDNTACLISDLPRNVSKTGNIWLPTYCFK